MSERALTLLLGALLLLLALFSLSVGPTGFDAMAMVQAFHASPESSAVATILWDIRLPRVAAAILSGLALGASGAAMQGLLRNPLAEPGTMGVSASAALAATAMVYFGFAAAGWRWLVPVAAIGGALAATGLIALTGLHQRGIGSMVLIGVAISALAGAVMALFVNLAPNPFSLSDLINWTAGSVANRDWLDIGLAAPFILTGCGLLLLTRRALSALLFGEDSAHALGVDLSRTRLLVVVGTGLATGGAVAMAGMIGFVGLIAPHMVRAAVGHDAGRLMLPAALGAAILLLLADLGIRLLPWGGDLHLGTVTALAGAPLFALIALRAGTLRHG